MFTRTILLLILALAVSACATRSPPGFVGPGQWVPDYAASPTPWSSAAVAANVSGSRFVNGEWR